jgi:hypothetical protein
MGKALVKSAGLLLFTITHLALFPANAFTSLLPSVYKSFGKIAVGSDIGLPGHLLCQDGQNIHFRSRTACAEANSALPESSRFDCYRQLRITPISEVEEIFIPEAPEKTIMRFFTVPTRYEEKTYRKRQAADGSERFELVQTKLRRLPQCSHAPRLPFTNIFETREATTEQKYLILALRKRGMTILNAPYGTLNLAAKLAPKRSLVSSVLTRFHFLSHAPSQVGSLLVKTPHCNPFVTDQILNELLGGESTGGGYRSLQSDTLQSLSVGLEIRSRLNREQWNLLRNRPFDPRINAFELECAPSSAAAGRLD